MINRFFLGASLFCSGRPGSSWRLLPFPPSRGTCFALLSVSAVYERLTDPPFCSSGFFEAAVTPGLSLMTGFYYTRGEAPLRQTIWYGSVGWGGMIGSLMAAGIEKANASSLAVPKWGASASSPALPCALADVRFYSPALYAELIFIVLGAITIAWGAVLYFFLADGPSNAFWLKPEQRTLAVARVAANGVGIKNKKFKPEQVRRAPSRFGRASRIGCAPPGRQISC